MRVHKLYPELDKVIVEYQSDIRKNDFSSNQHSPWVNKDRGKIMQQDHHEHIQVAEAIKPIVGDDYEWNDFVDSEEL